MDESLVSSEAAFVLCNKSKPIRTCEVSRRKRVLVRRGNGARGSLAAPGGIPLHQTGAGAHPCSLKVADH